MYLKLNPDETPQEKIFMKDVLRNSLASNSTLLGRPEPMPLPTININNYITDNLNPATTSSNTNTTSKESSKMTERMFKSLSDIVLEVTGKRFNSKQYNSLGRAVASAYRARYNGQNPSKCERFIGGTTRPVNAYDKKDWDLVEDVVKQYYNI
jgi:hypothetical protein